MLADGILQNRQKIHKVYYRCVDSKQVIFIFNRYDNQYSTENSLVFLQQGFLLNVFLLQGFVLNVFLQEGFLLNVFLLQGFLLN